MAWEKITTVNYIGVLVAWDDYEQEKNKYGFMDTRIEKVSYKDKILRYPIKVKLDYKNKKIVFADNNGDTIEVPFLAKEVAYFISSIDCFL